MIKFISKLLIIFSILFSGYTISYAGNIDFKDASSATAKFTKNSINLKSWDAKTQIQNTTVNIFKILKIVVWGLLIFFIVYAWAMMIFSMGDTEDKITEWKRTIWYSLIWLLFINIPWSLYSAFSWKRTTDTVTWSAGWNTSIFSRNIFINSEAFWPILWNLIGFLQMILAVFAVIILVFAWLQIMMAQWKDDVVSKAKSKIIYSILWLFFLWILEAWKVVIYKWDLIKWWQEIFASLANLALFFAWPVAIFFLSLAWYYYITSGWSDDKIKKAKNIVINTLLATLILIWMYTFFWDLKNLF